MKNELIVQGHAELLVATFGRGNLVRTVTGRYEMRGGSMADLLEAREWAALFLPEAVVGESRIADDLPLVPSQTDQ